MNEALPGMRRQLRPLLEMLKHKEALLAKEEWIGKVKDVQKSISDVPDQYLIDYPPREALDSVLELLFTEFLEESDRKNS